MRALAHIPLLSMPAPTRVLVIGFGVGNSTHAATLHPSVERVDVADLSRDILDHAGYFSDANKDVLKDPRVSVYVNDGRQHLADAAARRPTTSSRWSRRRLRTPASAALYSREFYALARTRLKPGGYLSQWLPAYQVPAATSLAMVRAFIDVFPQSVLLSGTEAELLLVGTSGGRIEIDPVRVSRALEQAPGVAADLRRLDLGSVTEIVGTFVGSADTLARATQPVDGGVRRPSRSRNTACARRSIPGRAACLRRSSISPQPQRGVRGASTAKARRRWRAASTCTSRCSTMRITRPGGVEAFEARTATAACWEAPTLAPSCPTPTRCTTSSASRSYVRADTTQPPPSSARP